MARRKKDLHNQAIAAIAAIAPSDAKDTKAQKDENGRFDATARKHFRQRIATWMFTPEPYRDPVTLQALAKELGISYGYARQIKRTIPTDVKKFLEAGDLILAVRWPEIAEAIAEKSASGSKDHIGIARAVKDSVLHERATPEAPKMPKHVEEAFKSSPEYVKRQQEKDSTLKTQSVNPQIPVLPKSEGNA